MRRVRVRRVVLAYSRTGLVGTGPAPPAGTVAGAGTGAATGTGTGAGAVGEKGTPSDAEAVALVRGALPHYTYFI